MKTDELVAMLATGAGAVRPHAALRRHALALGVGVPVSALMLVLLLGVRHDLADAVLRPMYWVKLAYVAALAAASVAVALRVSRPGVRVGRAAVALWVPLIAMWLLAAGVLFTAAPGERAALFMGRTWSTCPWLIALFSLPIFAGALWAMKGLAPPRPRVAGAAAGFMAGAVGALVYSIHCPELTAPFLGFWYFIGMLIPAGAGALAGPRLLRW
jgi:hypothetical protein